MGRASTRYDAARYIVLVMACMMIVSIAGSGGHVLHQNGPGHVLSNAMPARGAHHEETGEEEADAHGNGSFMLGMEALGESFAPEFLPLPDEGMVFSMSVIVRSSAHLPRIFRPPIA